MVVALDFQHTALGMKYVQATRVQHGNTSPEEPGMQPKTAFWLQVNVQMRMVVVEHTQSKAVI